MLCGFVSVHIACGFYTNPDQRELALIDQTGKNNSKPSDASSLIGIPVLINIPKIGVNAVIRRVGVEKDGSMGVPSLPRDAAWYMLGPKPGELGSAVISGHVNWYSGAKGSFERVKYLKPGDKIIVQDDKGKKTTFVVRRTREYGYQENATDVFYSNDGKSHLNLITCSGVWLRSAHIYSKRLVVFADKVTE